MVAGGIVTKTVEAATGIATATLIVIGTAAGTATDIADRDDWRHTPTRRRENESVQCGQTARGAPDVVTCKGPTLPICGSNTWLEPLREGWHSSINCSPRFRVMILPLAQNCGEGVESNTDASNTNAKILNRVFLFSKK